MSERERLLRRLSAAQFAAWELNVFLDTHPNNAEALARYKAYKRTAEELMAQFESKFGPLEAQNVYNDARFDWVNNPWPWEIEGECE